MLEIQGLVGPDDHRCDSSTVVRRHRFLLLDAWVPHPCDITPEMKDSLSPSTHIYVATRNSLLQWYRCCPVAWLSTSHSTALAAVLRTHNRMFRGHGDTFGERDCIEQAYTLLIKGITYNLHTYVCGHHYGSVVRVVLEILFLWNERSTAGAARRGGSACIIAAHN